MLVEARAAYDDGCTGSINGVVITGDVTNPEGVSCVVNVAGIDAAYAQDAVASAAVVVKNIACGDAPRQVDDVSRVRPAPHLLPLPLTGGTPPMPTRISAALGAESLHVGCPAVP